MISLDSTHHAIDVVSGDDERIIYNRLRALAIAWGCEIVSTRGSPWPKSKGRRLVFAVVGDPTRVQDFRAALYLGIADGHV